MIIGSVQVASIGVFLRRFAAAMALGLCLLIASPGCRAPRSIRTADRYTRGVVFVLPGIEGRSVWNRNIALGLDEGGVASAIEVYDWTTGVPGTFVYNLANLDRNRQEARKLADRILAYRDRYPGSPVHVIGLPSWRSKRCRRADRSTWRFCSPRRCRPTTIFRPPCAARAMASVVSTRHVT
jgi:hypothetical protein